MPVRKYGGTERVVVWLCTGLRDLGHRVTLIAARDTRVPGVDVVEVDAVRANRRDFDVSPFLPPNTDVVHFFVPVHHPPAGAHLWTMQGNARAGFEPGPNCVFVSADHARRHSSSAFVHNGIDLGEYTFRESRDGPLLFLGRLSSSKGWKTAIEVALKAGRELVVAGGWRPSLRRGIRYAGKVGGATKTELLASASALLMPVRWAEPFGIVVAEALASGTPVIGCPRGSLPELIPPHVGGLSDDVSELAEMARKPGWDPGDCRKHAETHFDHRLMCRRYVEIYQRLLDTGTIG